MKRLFPLSIVAVLSFSLSGCIPLMIAGAVNSSHNKQQSAKDRMRATNLAEAEGKKALAAIDAEADRQQKQAEEVGQTNPRAGCTLRAEAQNKACVDRNAFYLKSSLSMFHSRADPERCKTDMEAALKICGKLPETN